MAQKLEIKIDSAARSLTNEKQAFAENKIKTPLKKAYRKQN